MEEFHYFTAKYTRRLKLCMNRMWGGCIVRVIMELPPLREPPSYGRFVLSSPIAVEAILGGQPLVKLLVKSRQLWVRKYVSRRPPPQEEE
jgi:hypothetical protein